MKAKLILALSCLAGASALAHADPLKAGLTGAAFSGAGPEAGGFMKVARARIFLGYDIYGHPIYTFRHLHRVLLGYDRFGRPIFGYIVNNRPVFLTRSAVRFIVRPAHVEWDWGGRHWDRRWAGRGDRGEHRGWVEGEHRGWDRHDRDHMRPGYGGEVRGGADFRGSEARGGEVRGGADVRSGGDQHRRSGDEARSETRGGTPNTGNAGATGSSQAPSGSQAAQSSGMRHDRHGAWRRNDSGVTGGTSATANTNGSASTTTGSQGGSANSQTQGTANVQQH